ncbi:MAG: DNRLRE domain-containing protein [Planctomycetota bacterium]
MRHLRSLVTALAVISLLEGARADSITIEPSQDNTLYESATGALSNGKGEHLFCGRRTSNSVRFRRPVIKFDVAASIPAGARIDSVTLTLNASRTRGGASTVELRPLLQSWGEGTSDAPNQEGGGAGSTTGDATWIHTFFSTGFWTSAGGDFGAVSASTPVNGSGVYTWGPTASMVSAVQDWLDHPANNFGWILIGDESTPSVVKRFDSRENPTPANRPKLTVVFCPPATWSNYGTGLAGTFGIPTITSDAPPVLCSNITMAVGNSRGASTPAALFLGFAKAQIPSAFGSDLLLVPVRVFSFTLPAGGASFPFNVICDDAFCGVSIYMQCLEVDPGAIHGVSFTPGIDFDHGV